MPRQARLDAPGTLHHIMIRGIEKRRIVDDNQDREQFVNRRVQKQLIRQVYMANFVGIGGGVG